MSYWIALFIMMISGIIKWKGVDYYIMFSLNSFQEIWKYKKKELKIFCTSVSVGRYLKSTVYCAHMLLLNVRHSTASFFLNIAIKQMKYLVFF